MGAPVESVSLVAMPWSRRDRPSAAVAALAAYVRTRRPQVRLQAKFEYVTLSGEIGSDLYDAIAESHFLGDLLYMPLLYPDRRASVREQFTVWATSEEVAVRRPPPGADWSRTFDHLLSALDAHVGELAKELAASSEVVGLTTCFRQLFANLALAQRVKDRAKDTTIVLGGSALSGEIGPSLLEEYESIDFIVQGEGERRLVAILDGIARDETFDEDPGIIRRGKWHASSVSYKEAPSLEELPIPDYDEYARVATEQGIDWQMPVEGSRGCWWDRSKSTHDPMNACYFCALNVQWGGYRHKSPVRIADELVMLSERHRNLRIQFMDNVLPAHGVGELAEAIRRTGSQFELLCDVRASIRPHDVVKMWEAGWHVAVPGIESLSNAQLERMGMGTTAIQNLQLMKIARELDLRVSGNLLVGFPGSTDEEVAECRDVILDYALAYEPLDIARFALTRGSAVEQRPEIFGIRDVRNLDLFKVGLPEEVWRRIALQDLSFDVLEEAVDWAPVLDAREHWRALHDGRRHERLLSYRDGGSFLRVEDRRFGDLRCGRFPGLARAVYLYCTEVRSFDRISRRFKDAATEPALVDLLGSFVASKIMFQQGRRYLSLAMAPNSMSAADRIRRASAERSRDA